MKRKNLAKQLIAWVLLITFIAALGMKGSHYHDNDTLKHEHSTTTHASQITSKCFICECSMHKVGDVTPYKYVSMVVCTIIHKPQPQEPVVIYRSVESVNAHAPPYFCT